jgi:signal transduction histidine kinase
MMNEEKVQEILEILQTIPVFADLPDEHMRWLIGQSQDRRLETGEVLFYEGHIADSMYVLLSGEFQIRFEADPSDPFLYVIKKGEIGGKLPFSRMKNWGVTGRAMTPCRILSVSTSLFPEMGQRMPVLIERLVAVMSDRIRLITREDDQRDRLAALGKLSAGLAHELNNPAAAAKRCALALSEAQEALRQATAKLDQMNLTADQRIAISTLERQAHQSVMAMSVMDALAQSDREDEVTTWLEKHGMKEAWKLAPTIVEANLGTDWLDQLAEKAGNEALSDALNRITSQILAKKLTKEIETCTGRISELVKAIKEYSYMDRAPIQESDIHQGIESTLVMLNYKLRHSIQVERAYDRTLPPVCAYGSELNQVWTNLIDNSVDAMPSGGKLTIRTALEGDRVLVEIGDTGHGIPAEIQGRIFEPFFTTKKMGQGTGLGLDLVYRIIRRHQGDIRVESKPGDTRFQVRLPISQPRIPAKNP